MQFNVHIEHLCRISDIFSLFSYLTEKTEPKYSFFLESVEESKKETLFSFICLEPDYLISIKEGNFKYVDILTERGDIIKEHLESRELKRSEVDSLFDDRVDYEIEALDILANKFPINESIFPEIFPRRVFFGGYLGYIGYDVVAPWVGFKSRAQTPDAMLGMNTKVLIYNHKTV